jgi:hypothetical protein
MLLLKIGMFLSLIFCNLRNFLRQIDVDGNKSLYLVFVEVIFSSAS